MWPCLLLACCGAAPIFDARPDNPWDELRQVFYSHRFTNGEIYEHDVSLDSAPWSNWAPFYNNEQFYSRVVAILDAFLELPADEVEKQPAVRRAILLRDLWSVFDAQTQNDLTKPGVAADRQTALRERLAKIMRRLELAEREITELPDNFKAAIVEKTFATDFDPQSPEKGFLPPDLFDEGGPWVAIARGKKTPGAAMHLQSCDYRSIFVPYIRVSADRQRTLDFLERYRKSPMVPAGAQLALVRRTALPTTSGRIMATSITESLQIMIIDRASRPRFKYVLDRKELMAGRPALRMLTKEDQVDAYSSEAGGLFTHDTKNDADGEMLVLGRQTGPITESSLGYCCACHRGSRLFANFGDSSFVVPTTLADQTKIILSLKERQPNWKVFSHLTD